jgi:subtilase family protein
MKRLLVVIALVLFAVPALAGPASVLLKSRTITTTGDAVPWAELDVYAGRHILVQFAQTPDAAAREALAADGIRLLTPIPEHSYLAYIEPRAYAEIKDASPFTLVTDLAPEDKLHPRLVTGEVDPYLISGGETLLLVKFFVDADNAAREEMLVESGARLVSAAPELDLAYLAVPMIEDAYLLAEYDAVEFVTLPEPAYEALNDKARAMVGAETAWTVPYNVNGDGVPVLVYDAGHVPTGSFGGSKHPDLANRLDIGPNSRPEFGIYHATHVSCTVAGAGTVSSGTYAGMAPAANIVSMDITTATVSPTDFPFVHNSGDIDMSYRSAIEDFGVLTANNSIGANLGANRPTTKCEWMGDYTVTGALIDMIIRGRHSRPLSIVWANGNEVGSGCSNGYGSTPPPATAKNALTVGALSSVNETIASFSSRGPTDDGRLRPDIAAPGSGGGIQGINSCGFGLFGGDPGYQSMSGTSMAAPVVTGATALLMEYWQNTYPGTLPAPALVKAIALHAAKDVGNAGPDFLYGYGSLRVPPMLDLVLAETFETITLDQGEQYVGHFVTDGKGPIKVTMVWDDVPGTPQAAKALVNDLDLKLIGPGGEMLPWVLKPLQPAQPATRGVDHINNVEQVYMPTPPAGDYQVVIDAFDVPQGPQDVSFVFTGLIDDPNAPTDDDDDDDDATPGDDDTVPTDDDDTTPSTDDDDAAADDDDDDNDDGGCGC